VGEDDVDRMKYIEEEIKEMIEERRCSANL
jgi:hypothetical protein